MADIDTAAIRAVYGAEFADGTVYDLCAEVDALRARLAAVEALCDREERHVAHHVPRPDALVSTEQVRAAATGDDRG